MKVVTEERMNVVLEGMVKVVAEERVKVVLEGRGEGSAEERMNVVAEGGEGSDRGREGESSFGGKVESSG